MRVLHVINDLSSGGAEKLLEESLPLYKKHEVEVELLVINNENNVYEKNLIDNNIKIYSLSKFTIRNPLNIFLIRKIIIEGDFDIVHSHLFPAKYWVSIASILLKNKKIKNITTEHCSYNRRRDFFIFKYIEKLIYRRFDRIISVSEATEKSLKKWLGVDRNPKFKTVKNGINLEKFYNAVKYNKNVINSNFNENSKLISMVGRLTPQKDQKTIINALTKLPKNVHLLLVGEGSLKKDLEILVKNLHLEDRVHFLGFRYDVANILKTSEIVVLSSNWEGLGLAAIEGMAVGKPVIVSNVPGLNEVIYDKDMIFEIGDYKELAEKINFLLNNKESYDKYSKKCRLNAKEFDIEKMVEKYVEIYNEVLE